MVGGAALDAESVVKLVVGIGDGAGGGPVALKEGAAVVGGALVDEEDGRIACFGFRSTAEVAHGFAREESAELAEEDEEGGVGSELVAQGAGAEVEAGDWSVESRHRDGHVSPGCAFRWVVSAQGSSTRSVAFLARGGHGAGWRARRRWRVVNGDGGLPL